jgi:ribose 5-phosphate isomerase A
LKNFDRAVKPAVLEATSQIKGGDTIGLGSGRTMACVIKELGKLVQENGLDLKVVPSSYQAEILAIQNGLEVIKWIGESRVDLAIDGADQVEVKELNMIKGGGAALTREKILDSNAKKLIIVIDEEKLTDTLGLNQSVPIEIIPFGYGYVFKEIKKLGGAPILRESNRKVGPVITDNCNFIADIYFSAIKDPKKLESNLKLIPGVVESGLFIEMANKICIAKRDNKIEIIERD